MKRTLYLACYDVVCSSRLLKALRILREFASGGQYSCFECYLTAGEKRELLLRMQQLLTAEDAFLLMPLPDGQNVIAMGAAVAPIEHYFYIVG